MRPALRALRRELCEEVGLRSDMSVIALLGERLMQQLEEINEEQMRQKEAAMKAQIEAISEELRVKHAKRGHEKESNASSNELNPNKRQKRRKSQRCKKSNKRKQPRTIEPPINNYVTNESGAMWVCCTGVSFYNQPHIQCGKNKKHFEHRRCLKQSDIDEWKKSKSAYQCRLCSDDDYFEIDAPARDSDPNYESEDDEDENNDFQPPNANSNNENEPPALRKIYHCFEDTNIVLYGTSADKQYVQRIKTNHISSLVRNLNSKLVLAKNISLFSFLSPNKVIRVILQVHKDIHFKPSDYDTFTKDQVIDEYFQSIQYGESQINEICSMFPHIFEKERLICEWRLYRTGLYKANRNKQKYDHFWSQFLFDAAWTKSNPNLYILVSMMIVICLASVNCERGFSTMGIIKSSTRNTFLVSTVRHVMLIQKSKWNMNDWLGHLSLIVGKFRDMKERRGPYATRKRKR